MARILLAEFPSAGFALIVLLVVLLVVAAWAITWYGNRPFECLVCGALVHRHLGGRHSPRECENCGAAYIEE